MNRDFNRSERAVISRPFDVTGNIIAGAVLLISQIMIKRYKAFEVTYLKT
jgi:hypothetical protein